jgi:hypothetical protein
MTWTHPRRLLWLLAVTTLVENLVSGQRRLTVIFGRREGNKRSASLAGGTARQLDPSFPTAADAALRIHPDGRQVVYGTGTNAVKIWALENFLPVQDGKRQGLRKIGV